MMESETMIAIGVVFCGFFVSSPEICSRKNYCTCIHLDIIYSSLALERLKYFLNGPYHQCSNDDCSHKRTKT